MARRRSVKSPETHRQMPLPAFPDAMGVDRVGAGWISIGIATAAFLFVGANMIAIGAPEVMLAVGPILLALGLLGAAIRVVRIDPEAGEVVVIRRLLGFSWARRRPLHRFGKVAIRCGIARPRRSIVPDTLEGNQVFIHYDLYLVAPGRLRIADFWSRSGPEAAREAAEGLALALGARMGVTVERRGWRLTPGPDGTLLSEPKRGHVEPLRGDHVAAAAALAARLEAAGNATGGISPGAGRRSG